MTAVLTGTAKRVHGGLPAEVTSFVGRRHEVAEVKRLLSSSRVVTLTGVGGVGKTRLALRVAAEVRRAFAGGVWLVELAELENPELLAQTVADAVGVHETVSRSALDALLEHLDGKPMLLVLDNCEHLHAECAVLVETLVRALPDLRVLATSRQAFGVASEQTLEVMPLPLPGAAAGGEPQVVETDAVRLFAKRASAVLPEFAVTEDNKAAVAAICRRLDGLPLAIELAAVRLRALSVEQVLERLDDRFRLLTGGSQAVLPRQRTLRALIDWSYDLCTEQERLMWQRASVFCDGLDLEAAEEVCAGDGIARADILDLIIGLVEKSVLIREERDGAVRYRLLDTIRQYGRDRLAESGQGAVLRLRHRDHYRRLAASANAEVFGPGQVAWCARLRREHANLRTALQWSFEEPGQARVGMDMAADLLCHWVTSHATEGRTWLEHGLAAGPEPTSVRARGLWACARVALIQGDQTAAAAMLDEARMIAEPLGPGPLLGSIVFGLGMLAMCQGDVDTGIARYRQAAQIHQAAGDDRGLALALSRLCMAHAFCGNGMLARSYGTRCVTLCEAHHEEWHRAYARLALGIEAWLRGEAQPAAELVKDSLRHHHEMCDHYGIGMSLEGLAWIAAGERQYERAARLLGVLRGHWQAAGAPMAEFRYLRHYHDECEAITRKALGDRAYAAALRRGAGLTTDEKIAYALQEETMAAAARTGAVDRMAPLTRRETEIAELVAQGLSNKDIAATLVISQRTAEGHIEHILDKLGFNSRAQIAAWLSERTRAGDG